jgi:hypothetical protein
MGGAGPGRGRRPGKGRADRHHPRQRHGRGIGACRRYYARANFESLVPDFKLIRRESEVENWDALPTPILIGRTLARSRAAAKERKIDLDALAPHEGVVFLFTHRNQGGIVCAAGSNDALLKTGRAYFLRWPYFWEIWGREAGRRFTLEADLAKFLGQDRSAFSHGRPRGPL